MRYRVQEHVLLTNNDHVRSTWKGSEAKREAQHGNSSDYTTQIRTNAQFRQHTERDPCTAQQLLKHSCIYQETFPLACESTAQHNDALSAIDFN